MESSSQVDVVHLYTTLGVGIKGETKEGVIYNCVMFYFLLTNFNRNELDFVVLTCLLSGG